MKYVLMYFRSEAENLHVKAKFAVRCKREKILFTKIILSQYKYLLSNCEVKRGIWLEQAKTDLDYRI